MLNDAEQQAVRESIGRVRRQALGHLQQMHKVEHVVQFVGNLHRSLDTSAAHAASAGNTPACQAGCSYCCKARVQATEPEVFLIARTVRGWPAARAQELVQRLKHHAETQTRHGEDGAKDAAQDCAFLQDKRCSIYDVRPGVCRKAHSLSVQHCETLSPTIPQNLALIVQAEALMAGTNQAYRERQLSATPTELNAAVLQALTDDRAEARWFQGEPVF